MFRKRPEFYKARPSSPGAEKQKLEKLLDPSAIVEEEKIDRSIQNDFNEIVKETADKISPRNPCIFGVGHYGLINDIPDGEYDLNLELIFPSIQYPYSLENRKTKIKLDRVGDKTQLFYINPENGFSRGILRKLRRDSEGILMGESMQELEERVLEARDKIETPLTTDFDPEEIALFWSMWGVEQSGIRNAKFAQNYFMQMASLWMTGSFMDMAGSKFYSGIKGLSPNDKSYLLAFSEAPGKIRITEDLSSLTPSRIKEFRNFLKDNVPWYKNENFQRNLDLGKIIFIANQLGGMFRQENEEGHSAVSIGAIATENLTSEIYETLKGKDCNGEDFVSKLKYINKNLGENGLLDPFLSVYVSDKISPARIRGDMVHVGNFRSSDNRAAYYWAAEFYIDLAKTLLTGIAGKGTQYLEFDTYARRTGLVNETKNSVAYVPKSSLKRNSNLEE